MKKPIMMQPVMVQYWSPYVQWYSTTRNFNAAQTVIWFALGKRVDARFREKLAC